MMKKSIVSFLFCLSVATFGFDYTVTVTPNEGVVGDVFRYVLDLQYSESETLVSIPNTSLFKEFHIQDKVFKKNLEGGTWSLKFSVDFQVFDIGEVVIPTHSIKYKKRGLKTETISAIHIPIQSLALNDDGSVDIDDLKPLPKISLSKKSVAYLVMFIIFTLALISGIWILWKKRKNQMPVIIEEKEIDPRTAVEKYLALIDVLILKQLIEKEEFKAFYTELVEIIKQFILDITKIDVVDMTTVETIHQIEEILDLQTIRRLKNVLDFSDLVKFSKFDPRGSAHDDYIVKAREVITRIQKNDN
jgi:hypothetical protein